MRDIRNRNTQRKTFRPFNDVKSLMNDIKCSLFVNVTKNLLLLVTINTHCAAEEWPKELHW